MRRGAWRRATLNDVPAERYVLSDDEWAAELRRRPRLRLEHLALEGETPARAMLSQPTTRYHGNVAAFMAEVRGRVQGGAQVMVSAASTGEMERLADLCHENELPYRLGELDDTATGVRLAEESSGGSIPALVLCKAPLIGRCRVSGIAAGDLWQRGFIRIASGTGADAWARNQRFVLQRSLGSQAE